MSCKSLKSTLQTGVSPSDTNWCRVGILSAMAIFRQLTTARKRRAQNKNNQTCYLVPNPTFGTLQSVNQANWPRIFQFAVQYRF